MFSPIETRHGGNSAGGRREELNVVKLRAISARAMAGVIILSSDVAAKAGIKPGDAVVAEIGSGADYGWLRIRHAGLDDNPAIVRRVFKPQKSAKVVHVSVSFAEFAPPRTVARTHFTVAPGVITISIIRWLKSAAEPVLGDTHVEATA